MSPQNPTFADLGAPKPIVDHLADRGITEPFPIQTAVLADALSGRDILGRAPTGSGKTLAFGIPLVTRMDKGQRRRPTALILSPTRELAEQIGDELRPSHRAWATAWPWSTAAWATSTSTVPWIAAHLSWWPAPADSRTFCR
ncbi:MAG: DEAD/DEAH box helicase [Microthrixaceae bacterium]